jgi:hypothetical protein
LKKTIEDVRDYSNVKLQTPKKSELKAISNIPTRAMSYCP